MLADLLALARRITRLLTANCAPSQLAIGFTLGMIIGVLPKTNLIAVALYLVMFSVRGNKGLGLVTAIAFSFLGPWTDPFTHKLGLAVLNIGALQLKYTSLLNAPLGPWIGFNNTVVIGTLLAGLWVAYPVYWFVKMFFRLAQSTLWPGSGRPGKAAIAAGGAL